MGNRRYSPKEKGEAVKLAEEIGGKDVELQISADIQAKARKGTLQTESKANLQEKGDKKKARLHEKNTNLKKELKSMKSLNEQIQKEKKLQKDTIDFLSIDRRRDQGKPLFLQWKS